MALGAAALAHAEEEEHHNTHEVWSNMFEGIDTEEHAVRGRMNQAVATITVSV